MVEKTFGKTLAQIQGYDLDIGVEEATKQGVILPLLNRVGWDTEDVNEVFPEYPVASVGKVDYALRIGETNQVFVEAKSWGGSLGEGEEDQLERYIQAVKPRPCLGVLTNGRHWSLYLPPGPGRPGKNQKIRLFLEFDITDPLLEPDKLEENFNRFLARGNVSNQQSVKQTVAAARDLLSDKQSQRATNDAVASGLKVLGQDDPALIEFLTKLAEKQGIQPEPAQIMAFIKAWKVNVEFIPPGPGKGVNKKVQPVSFIFQTEGEKPVARQLPKSAWSQLLVGVCELMRERHSDTFGRILEIQGFAKSDDGMKSPIPIFRVGLYFPYPGGATGYRQVCAEVLAKFGYPRSCLTVRVKGGMEGPL